MGGNCGDTRAVRGQTTVSFRRWAGKFGFLTGVQWYSLILVFSDQAALDKFRPGEGWAGADASVAVAEVGASGTLDTVNI